MGMEQGSGCSWEWVRTRELEQAKELCCCSREILEDKAPAGYSAGEWMARE